MIVADHEQLRHVFLNLVLNSLDALPHGGTIQVIVSGDAGVSVTVADDGPGISLEPADLVFEPYVSTKDSGLGLGLAICRRIVDAHGGRITAANGPDGGAVFTVRLPDLPEQGAGSGERGARTLTPRSPPLLPQGEPMQSLLIIDDEPNVCYTLEKVLGSAGSKCSRPLRRWTDSTRSAASRPTP